MTDHIVKMAIEARQSASLVVDRHVNPGKTKASKALYKVLADCMAIAERCEKDPNDYAKIRKLFDQQPKEGVRRYIEKSNDIFGLVSRFVFTDSDRTNAARYAACLRVAKSEAIASDKLAEYMWNNGGVNALYFRRKLDVRLVRTKCLRLDRQIVIDRDRPLTITLQWRDDNSFIVIEGNT